MGIPITQGSGQTSIASEKIGVNDFQQIEIFGGGGASVLSVNPDGSLKASIIGTPTVSLSGSGSVVTVPQGSVAVVIIGGSIAASFTPPANQSVSGTVGASIIGIPTFQTGNSSVITIAQSSIAVAIVSGSIAATFTPPANQSVSGTAGASIIGLPPFVLGGSTNASVITVGGSAPGNQSVSGAVNISGSVLLGSSNASVIAYLQSSSIIAINAGSVIAIPSGSVITVLQAASIVGTYAEDAPAASGDKGFLVMGARNDTLASVTSNDGDYSSHVVGPAGELIAENAPLTKWVSGTASMLGGVPLTSSVIVIAAQGASVFTYITGIQVANLGSASVLVGFYGATSSLIAYTMAPAGGGSNINIVNGIKTNANGAFSASVSGTASIFVSAQGFISKT